MAPDQTKLRQADLVKALSTLESLETTTKKLKKEEYLFKEKDNPALRTILLMALGNERYFIHPTPDLSRCSGELSLLKSWKKFLVLTEKLASRGFSGTADATVATEGLLYKCDPDVAKWYFRILEHNLEIGVSKKTVQLVWGKQFFKLARNATDTQASAVDVPWDFRGCMLATKREKLPKKYRELPFPLAGEFKLDGERFLCAVFPNQAQVQIVSRGNHRKYHIEKCIPFRDQLISAAFKLGKGEPIFLDGEFLSSNWNETSSIVGSTKNFDEEVFLSTTAAILFDWAPLSAYQTGEFSMPWSQRKSLLLGELPEDPPIEGTVSPRYYIVSPNLAVLGHSILNSEEDLLEFYDLALQLKFEGAITKLLQAPAIFDDHRGHEVVKHKAEDAKTGVITKCLPGKKSNSACDAATYAKAKRWMTKHGEVVEDKYYLRIDVNNLSEGKAKQLEAEFKLYMKDAVVDRAYLTDKGELTYRHSARLGRFVVECDGETFHVGTGFKIKNGTDERMKFWKKRKKLIGVKVDFKHQRDPDPVAVMRFNSFVRIREDL